MPTWYYVALHPEARFSANDQSVLRDVVRFCRR